MLELIGQLATVAFVARLGGPSFGSSGAPLALSRVTSCYLGLLALVTVLASVGALSQSAMADAIKRLADQVERLQPAGS